MSAEIDSCIDHGFHNPMPVEQVYEGQLFVPAVMPRDEGTYKWTKSRAESAERVRVTKVWCPNCKQMEDIDFGDE